MKIEREAHWYATINYVMAHIVRADAWVMELSDRSGKELSVLGKNGDIEARDPGYRQTMRKLATTAERQGKFFSWRRLDIPDRHNGSDAVIPRSLLQLFCPIGTDDMLIGAVLLDRSVLEKSVFKGETKLLSFLAGAAAGAARERRVAREIRAMKSLLSALAVDCVVVDRSGRVVLEASQAADASGESGASGDPCPWQVRGIIHQVLKQYRSAPEPDTQPCQVASVDLGSGHPAPVYVLPLPNDAREGADADFLALILPRPSEPPSDEILAAALSLTPAEARVVRQIMFGKRIRLIAEEMSLTEQTVRTYLKRTYAKLGVSSQSELIARVNDLSVPLNMA